MVLFFAVLFFAVAPLESFLPTTLSDMSLFGDRKIKMKHHQHNCVVSKFRHFFNSVP